MAQERTTDESDTDEVRGLALPIAFVGGLLGRLAFWAPVVFAFLFLAQASLKGLKPALAEEQRLTDEEARMRAVHEGLLEEQTSLERRLEAYRDPIYLEREKRARLLRDRAPATVDSPTPYGAGGPGSASGAGDAGEASGSGPAGPSTSNGPRVR